MKYKLGEICEIVSGSTPKTSISEYWDGKVKWITPAELKEDTYIIEDSVRKITEKAVKDTGLTSFPEGTVILSSRAPIGKVAIAGCEMYCNQGFKNLICSDKIYNRYLYWFLRGKTKYLESLGRGATFKEISKQIVANIEIDIPDLCEQHKIVRVLERINKLIGLRQEESKYLDSLIKARFIELFGDPKDNPKGYSKKQLKETCRVITGNTPSRAVSEYYGDHIEWIKTDNIVSGLLNPTTATESLSEKGMAVSRTVESGAILMACIAGSIASIGRVCVTDRKVAFNQQINAIVPSDYNILFLYVMLQISKEYLVDEINMALKGILSKSKLEEKTFYVPPMELQEQFAAFVAQTDKSKVTPQKATKNRKNTLKRQLRHYNSTTHHTQGGFPA